MWLKSSDCKAANLHCFLCMKPGHFPKSLCCQKRRKSNRSHSLKIKNHVSKQLPITKVNLKLIKRKILQLEKQSKMESVVKLAEKCAQKFGDRKYEHDFNKFSRYCSKKLQILLNLEPIPTAEESYQMQNILNVFDQMFYSNRSNSEDQFVEDGEAVNPDHKAVGDTKSQLDGLEEAVFNHDEEILNKHLLNDQINCLGEEIFNKDYKIPQFDGGIDDISSQSDEEIEGHLIP